MKYRVYRDPETNYPKITNEIDKELDFVNEVIYDDEDKAINYAIFLFSMETNFGRTYAT